MLLIDTIDVDAEGTHTYKTSISAGEIIKCFLLGIPCVLRTEIEALEDTKTSEMAMIFAVNHGGEAEYLSVLLGGNYLYVATVTDPEDPAVFEAE